MEREFVMHCKHCKHWGEIKGDSLLVEKFGYCLCETMNETDESSNAERLASHLLTFAYYDCGSGFYVREDFGCINFSKKRGLTAELSFID